MNCPPLVSLCPQQEPVQQGHLSFNHLHRLWAPCLLWAMLLLSWGALLCLDLNCWGRNQHCLVNNSTFLDMWKHSWWLQLGIILNYLHMNLLLSEWWGPPLQRVALAGVLPVCVPGFKHFLLLFLGNFVKKFSLWTFSRSYTGALYVVPPL
jgi:hypothetical protein